MSEREKVLCVDDEPRVLEGLEAILELDFEILTAPGGVAGLEVLQREAGTDRPVAAVVSDMRMPGMDGAAFLALVRERHPDVTRLLLTGQADIESAAAAVNDGQIFRFLMKPCPAERLLVAVRAAVDQNRLVRVERDLLDKTLKSVVRTLGDVLSLTAPAAFSRGGALRAYVLHMLERMNPRDRWSVEIAASLAMIGIISVPDETLERYYAGQSLNEDEERMIRQQSEVGYRLLSRIPRLERVAEIIRHQDPATSAKDAPPEVQVGAAMLRLAHAVDRLVVRGRSPREAVEELRARRGEHDMACLDALADFRGLLASDFEVRSVRVHELTTYMTLDQDVRTVDGVLVVSRGHQVTPVLLERLNGFKRGVGLVEPIRVQVARTVVEGDPGRKAA